MSSFRFFQPPKGSPPSVFTGSVPSVAGIPSVPSAPSGPEVSIPLDPKKQQTKKRRKLFDLVMGKAKEGDLSFGEYRDLQGREDWAVGLSPEQFDKTFVDAGLVIDDKSLTSLKEGQDEYDVPMVFKDPTEQARNDALKTAADKTKPPEDTGLETGGLDSAQGLGTGAVGTGLQTYGRGGVVSSDGGFGNRRPVGSRRSKVPKKKKEEEEA